MSYHKEQYASLLKKELARFFDHHVPHPAGTFISVTRVDLNESDSRAIVWLSLYPDNKAKEVFSSLKAYEAEARRYLADTVQRRTLPFIVFVCDTNQGAQLRVEKLLDTMDNKSVAE